MRATPDGNCFYSALTQQLRLGEKKLNITAADCRQEICNFLRDNANFYKNFAVGDGSEAAVFKFVQQHRINGKWAEGLIFDCAARLYGLRINVLMVDSSGLATNVQFYGDVGNSVAALVNYNQSHFDSLWKLPSLDATEMKDFPVLFPSDPYLSDWIDVKNTKSVSPPKQLKIQVINSFADLDSSSTDEDCVAVSVSEISNNETVKRIQPKNVVAAKRKSSRIAKKTPVEYKTGKKERAKKLKTVKEQDSSIPVVLTKPEILAPFKETGIRFCTPDFVKTMTDLHSLVEEVCNKRMCEICNESFLDVYFHHKSDKVCKRCQISKTKSGVNTFSNQNFMIPQPQPEILKNLSVVEQMLISRYIPSVSVFYLQGGGQLAYRGNIVTFMQEVADVVYSLPRSTLPVVVVEKQFGNKHRYLRVRRNVIRNCLEYLQKHNKYYADINIDECALEKLPEDDFYEVERVTADIDETVPDNKTELKNEFDDVEISVMLNAPLNQLQKDIREKLLESKMQWPKINNDPINQFSDEGIFCMSFPHLFPEGDCDYKEPRSEEMTLGAYIAHFMRLKDDRFRRDPRFRYVALNMIMRWRAMADGRAFLKCNPNEARLSAAELREKLKNPNFVKRILTFSHNIVGSRSYWFDQRNKVEAMIRQIGIPTFFVTLSAADMRWPELAELFNSNSIEMTRHGIVNDPATADTLFMKRFEVFLQQFFMKHWNVQDYYIRVEYQHRGSPHVHGLVWMLDAPDIKSISLTEKEITDFVDKYICTCNSGLGVGEIHPPDYSAHEHPCEVEYKNVNDREKDLTLLANFVNRHTRCGPRCLSKKNTCKFGFPKELAAVTKCIRNKTGLTVTTKRNDPYMSSYSPEILSVWRANCDIQFIDKTEKLIGYLVKYTTKSEPRSTTLENISKLSNIDVPFDCPRKVVQQALMQTVADRDISAQETTHHLLSLFLCSLPAEIL
jgi:hypothetical protein